MPMAIRMSDYSARIRDYIAANILFSDTGFTYDDEASFLDEGIIDSLGVIELVTFVEKEFGVSVSDEELVPDNFDSVQKLNAYIKRKLGTQA